MAFQNPKKNVGDMLEEYCGLEMVASILHNLVQWLLGIVINIFIS
jgi:hypothetical protein